MTDAVLVALLVEAQKEGAQDQARKTADEAIDQRILLIYICLLYTSPSPRDATLSRMPSSA